YQFYLTLCLFSLLFFFNATPTTEIYTLSLHDALPISLKAEWRVSLPEEKVRQEFILLLRHHYGYEFDQMDQERRTAHGHKSPKRSEEHTSELQSLRHLVCRLLLEKKKQTKKKNILTKT